MTDPVSTAVGQDNMGVASIKLVETGGISFDYWFYGTLVDGYVMLYMEAQGVVLFSSY